MAELFEYSAPQSIISPTAPTIQVQPDQRLSNAFSNLNTLISSAAQAKTQQITQERLVIEEKTQILNAETRQRVATRKEEATLREKEEKARLKQEEDTAFRFFNDSSTALQADYNNAMTAAGDDITKQLDATARYSSEYKSLYGSLPEGTQTRVSNAFNTDLQAANKNFSKARNDSLTNQFYGDMLTAMPTAMKMTADQEAVYYNDIMATAGTLGISRKKVGEEYVNAQKSLLMSNIAANEDVLIRDYNVEAIDNALSRIDRLDAIDGRNADVIKSARDELNGIRRSINTNAVSALKGAIDNGDKLQYDAMFEKVVSINMTDSAELANLQQDFVLKYNSDSNVSKREAALFYESSNGVGAAETIIDESTRKVYKKAISEDIRANLFSETPDINSLKAHASNNPKVYATEYKAVLETKLGDLSRIINQMSSTKDEQKLQALEQQSFVALADINETENFNYGVRASDLKLKIDVAKTLATSSAIQNLPEALNNLNDLKNIDLVSTLDKNVKKLRDDVPDSFGDAHSEYSALIAAKVPPESALQAVTQKYSIASVNGMQAKASGAVLDSLAAAGLGDKARGEFESTLLDLLRENDYDDIADDIEELYTGTNVTVVKDGNDFKFYNDEGSVVRLPLNGQTLANYAQEVSTRYQDNNTKNGIKRVGYDVGTWLGDLAYDRLSALMDVATTGSPVISIASEELLNRGKLAVDTTVALGTATNNLVDDLLYNPLLTKEQAIGNFSSSLVDAWKNSSSKQDKINTERTAKIEEAVLNVGEALSDLVEMPSVESRNWLSKQAGALLDFIISPAEGSTLTPEISFRQVLKSVENEIKEGYNEQTGRWAPHASAEGGSDTLAYGHKLTPAEVRTGTVSIKGKSVSYTSGLTNAQADALLEQDLQKSEQGAARVFGNSWKTMSRPVQLLAAELVFNLGSSKFANQFDNFIRLASDPETERQAVREIGRTYVDKKTGKKEPLTNRVNAITEWFNSTK